MYVDRVELRWRTRGCALEPINSDEFDPLSILPVLISHPSYGIQSRQLIGGPWRPEFVDRPDIIRAFIRRLTEMLIPDRRRHRHIVSKRFIR